MQKWPLNGGFRSRPFVGLGAPKGPTPNLPFVLCKSLLAPWVLSELSHADNRPNLAVRCWMSTTFEPREVEKPFRMRWIRVALQHMLRAPVRFSIAILLLGCLDALVLHLLPNTMPGPWARRLGMLLLPLAWVVIAALARGVDNSEQNWKALTSLARPTVWVAALAIGLGLGQCVVPHSPGSD
jgi:hypothetical protein